MGKYFNNTDMNFIQSEEVAKLLHSSYKHPENFVAMSLYDLKYSMEKLCMFDSDESLMGIFKTENSTIFIIYDGNKDHVGYGYYLEKEGYPSIYEKLLSLFDISHPRAHDDNNNDSGND